MSYVLEALKRAEAERRRGAVPDLQAQPLLPTLDDEVPATGGGRGWRWAGVVAALAAAVALGAWWARGPAPAVEPQAAAVPRPGEPVLPVPPTAPLAVPLPGAVAPASPAAVVLPVPLPPTTPAPRPVAAPRPPAAPSPDAPAQDPLSAAAPAAQPPAARPTPASAPARLPTFAELPEALRRELPALTVGGAMYAEAAAQRMLVLNGQVLREGDAVAPQLVLEQIRLRSAVLNYKGQRWVLGW